MKCPICRMNNETVCNSRVRKDGTVWRRRVCFSCGYKWTTLEKYDYKTLEEVEEWKKSTN